MSEKQKILASSIQATKEKLKELESVQKQVEQQYKDGTIDQGQYLAFQQELAATRHKLKELKEEQKAFNQEVREAKIAPKIFRGIGTACDWVGDKLQKLGGFVQDIGTKLSTHVSAPIMGIGTAAVAAWNEVDDGADAIIKATGATGDAAEELEAIYKRIASDFPADFETIGTTLGEVNTRFGYSGAEAEKCTTQFLKFAEVTGTDALSAVQLVSRAMGDAGIPAEEYGKVLDMLTVAAQASGISVDVLATNLAKYGAPMRALGFETAESIAIFAQWEKVGVNTEIAFSGMKKAISNWSKQGKDARVEFRKTLNEIAACPDIASATTKAIEVFGAKAGPDLADAIQGGRFEFEEFLAIIEGGEGILDETYSNLEDGGTEAAKTMNSLNIAGAELGNTIQEMAIPVLQKVRDLIQKVTSHFQGLSKEQQEQIVKIGLVVAAVGPALMIMGSLISGIGKVVSVVGMLSKALAFLAANPVGLIITAIAALVAGFIYAYKHSEKFRDIVNKAMTKVKEVCTAAFSWISEKLTQAWEIMGPIFKKMGEVAKKVMGAMHATIKEKMSNIKNAYQEAGGGIKGVVAGTFEAVKGTWTAGLTFVDKLTGGKLTEIKNKFLAHHPEVKAIAEQGMNALKATVQTNLTNIKSAYDNAGGGIKGIVSGMTQAVKGFWTSGLTFIDNFTGGKLTAIKNAFSSKLQEAKNTVSNILENIRSAFSEKLEAARTAVSGAISKIKGLFNFSWKLPHLKLPHISITGKFSISPPSVPHFSISWYKNGGILDGAQIFGAMGGKLLGGGEAGKEAVLPLSDFYGELKSILGSFMQTPAGRAINVGVHIDRFENNSDRDLDELVEYVDDRLNEKFDRERVVFA